MDHSFNFAGGDKLSKIGATWFVSYAYYKKIDSSHRNWDNVSTAGNRINVYLSSGRYHKIWLQEILNMNDNKLNTNKIGIDAEETKRMARELLSIL